MPRFTLSPVKTTLAVVAVLAAWLLRHHAFVLGEVAYTYAAFLLGHQLLPEFDYPLSPADQSLQDAPPLAPAIFHHIYLDETCDQHEAAHACNVKPKYLANIETCRTLHPTWSFNLWTADNATNFVATHYPDVLHAYTSYRQTIQRANILRYLLLAHHGGVYLDLDIACRAPLDELRALSWLTPPAHPAGINNAFILAAAGHPFLTRDLIPRIVPHDLHWPLPYVENMLSTGCMFISAMTARFATPDMHVLAGGARHMLRGHVVTPLFEHGGDSSWHRWDAELFLTIGRNAAVLLAAVGGLFALAACALAVRMVQSRRRRRAPRSPSLGFAEVGGMKDV